VTHEPLQLLDARRRVLAFENGADRRDVGARRRADDALELRPTRGWAPATESVEGGTLGATGRPSVSNLLFVAGESTAGNIASVQDAGVLGPSFTGSMGHGAVPAGTEATPGEGDTGVAATWQVASGPELGHGSVPEGS
jgi:hypothetical protein